MAILPDRDALGGAPATTDLLFVTDVDDTTDAGTGTDKKMTVANLFTSPTLTTPVLGTPSSGNLSNCTAYPGDSSLTTVGTVTSGNVDAVVSAASTTTAGKVEIATAAETTTGTDAGRAVSPDALAGSDYGIRYIAILCFDYGTDTATGDGKGYIHIPSGLDGMNLVYAHAEVFTAGTTGTTDIQIHNVDNALDMLSTKLTIDSAETGSDTAATPAVINTSNDHVNTNDVIRIDVDAVSTTAAKGLLVTLGFQTP